ncbi:MAG: 50S ribosomal protein L18 [Chitinophagales bacterium]|jgi:large subunit ribosomal protein L18|nr:50S ribosomal protein L18 [Chitinophagales bacterium]
MAFNKDLRRQKIHKKVRGKITGTTERPRISVFRSNKYIYAQLIDDAKGHTIAAASSQEAAIASQAMPKVEVSKLVGKTLAERAIAAGITDAVFDRGGYLYHGRVKSLADGAREGGLNF